MAQEILALVSGASGPKGNNFHEAFQERLLGTLFHYILGKGRH